MIAEEKQITWKDRVVRARPYMIAVAVMGSSIGIYYVLTRGTKLADVLELPIVEEIKATYHNGGGARVPTRNLTTGEEFPSETAAALAVGGSVSGISNVLAHRQKTHRNSEYERIEA